MPDVLDICKDRMKKSAQEYCSAERLIELEDYNSAINRAYYAVFHVVRHF